MFKAKRYKLANGLKVVLVHMPGSPATTVEVKVETGSKYENDRERGLSHFLEHMCFKGTQKRPSAMALSQAFDELGAVNNAFTSTEVTGYYAKVSHQHTLKVLELIADIYLNPVFKEADVMRERGVIIEEINMYNDRPEAIAAMMFEKEIHGNQPAGLPIIGSKESVSAFTVKDFEAYHRKHYVAEATTLTVSGKFDEARVKEEIKQLFKAAPRSRKQGKKRTTITPRGVRVVHKSKETDQANLVLGFRSYPYQDKRNRVVALVRGLLSGGLSSRLFHKLREELGICYYVQAANSPSTDHGEFAVVAGVDPNRIEVAVKAIVAELTRLKRELVPEAELNKVKTSLISQLYLALETSDAVLDYFAERAIFHNDLKTPAEVERALRAVTAEDVRRVAKELFTAKDLVLTVVSRRADTAKLKQALALN